MCALDWVSVVADAAGQAAKAAGGAAKVVGGVAKVVGGVAKNAGQEVGSLLGKVNPDVWREVGSASVLAYSVLLSRREEIVDRGEDNFLPVILVHGLGGNRGTWYPLRFFLRLLGHRRVYALGYSGGAIDEHALSLKALVEKVEEVTGSTQVDIVAHSLGGIISRQAIQRLDLADSVRSLITLATPHQGTYAAHYAHSHLTTPLRPESALLKDLNRDDLTRLETRFISIYSDRDVYVVPWKGMTHPDAENIFVPEVSHTEHLFSLRVFQIVGACLEPVRGFRALSVG